jgi:anti-anti-sigma factor
MTATDQSKFSTKNPMVIDVEQCNRVCILRCRGRFVAGPQMDYMLTRMGDIKRLECTKLLADFQDVTSLGSMGVTFLVGVYASVVRKPGGRFVLVGASPHVKHVLDLTQLASVIPQASDLASGLAVLATESDGSTAAGA